jgi:hypothetical protein
LRRWAQWSFRDKNLLLCRGFFTIVGCLVVNQVAMCWRSDRNDDQSGGAAEDLLEQRASGVPRDDRNDDVRHKDSNSSPGERF